MHSDICKIALAFLKVKQTYYARKDALDRCESRWDLVKAHHFTAILYSYSIMSLHWLKSVATEIENAVRSKRHCQR